MSGRTHARISTLLLERNSHPIRTSHDRSSFLCSSRPWGVAGITSVTELTLNENTSDRGFTPRICSLCCCVLFGVAVGPRLSAGARPSLQPVLANLLDTADQRLLVGCILPP